MARSWVRDIGDPEVEVDRVVIDADHTDPPAVRIAGVADLVGAGEFCAEPKRLRVRGTGGQAHQRRAEGYETDQTKPALEVESGRANRETEDDPHPAIDAAHVGFHARTSSDDLYQIKANETRCQ